MITLPHLQEWEVPAMSCLNSLPLQGRLAASLDTVFCPFCDPKGPALTLKLHSSSALPEVRGLPTGLLPALVQGQHPSLRTQHRSRSITGILHESKPLSLSDLATVRTFLMPDVSLGYWMCLCLCVG